ncbi:MAG: hypothetical protein N3F05_05015, partial [Candidatus Diapherotrites archaeon]|nr:hypothetical protein [Candidatus Diapherotrites archaeon]
SPFFKANYLNGKVVLQWDPAKDNESGIEKYIIYKGNQKYAETTAHSYSDQNIVEGNTYTYLLSALDKAGNESYRKEASVLIPSSKPSSENISIEIVYPNEQEPIPDSGFNYILAKITKDNEPIDENSLSAEVIVNGTPQKGEFIKDENGLYKLSITQPLLEENVTLSIKLLGDELKAEESFNFNFKKPESNSQNLKLMLGLIAVFLILVLSIYIYISRQRNITKQKKEVELEKIMQEGREADIKRKLIVMQQNEEPTPGAPIIQKPESLVAYEKIKEEKAQEKAKTSEAKAQEKELKKEISPREEIKKKRLGKKIDQKFREAPTGPIFATKGKALRAKKTKKAGTKKVTINKVKNKNAKNAKASPNAEENQSDKKESESTESQEMNYI